MFSTGSAKAVTAAAGIMLSTAACSTGSHDAAVVKVTQAFTSAVQHRDGTAACALLTDDARQAVSGATDIPCAKAVTSAANPGTSVRTVEVWSDTAQVRIGADVITAPPAVIKAMANHVLTDKGLEQFNADWAKTGQKIGA